MDGASLERSIREATIAFAARRSFDAAKIAGAIGGAPVAEVEPIVERLFSSGLLNPHGVLRHKRTGASVLFNAYAGDPPGGWTPSTKPAVSCAA